MKPKKQSKQGESIRENPQTESRQAGVKNRKPKNQIQNIHGMSQGQQAERLEPGVGKMGQVQTESGIRQPATSN